MVFLCWSLSGAYANLAYVFNSFISRFFLPVLLSWGIMLFTSSVTSWLTSPWNSRDGEQMLFNGRFYQRKWKFIAICQIGFLYCEMGAWEKSLLFWLYSILIPQQQNRNASFIFEGHLPGISSNFGLLCLFIHLVRGLVFVAPLYEGSISFQTFGNGGKETSLLFINMLLMLIPVMVSLAWLLIFAHVLISC